MEEFSVSICEYTIVFQHGGTFKEEGNELLYVRGQRDTWNVDPDLLSGIEVFDRLEAMGYKNNLKQVQYRLPGKSLKYGLRQLWDDNSIIELIKHLHESKEVELYVSHIFEVSASDKIGVESRHIEAEHVECVIEASRVDADLTLSQTKLGQAETHATRSEIGHDDTSDSDPDEIDVDFVGGNDSEADDPELTQIREQVKLSQEKRRDKLNSVRLDRSPEDINREARCGIGTSYVVQDGHDTDYPSSDDYCSITEESDTEFQNGENEDTVTKEVTARFRKSGAFPCYEPTSEVPAFSVGQLFDDGKQLKNAICLAFVRTQRNICLTKNCKEYIRARCKSDKCTWFISARYMEQLGAYQVKTFSDKHTCSITFKNPRVNSSWLARPYMSTLRAVPSIKVTEFKMLVKEQLGVDVSRIQCRRAKEKIYDMLVGDSKAEYALMWDYATELRRSNDGSSVFMMVERPIPTEPPVFDRFYVCFEAVKVRFLKGCRQVIGVDGCFLKNVVKGQLLTTIRRDGNNQMFPIAWAVVQVESRDTWSWFLNLLKKDLNINDGLGWTFISDQQKGLVPAIAELLPSAEHRMCARHIYANWGGSHKGPIIQKQFWIIAKSTTEADFKSNMRELQKMSPQAYEDLLQRPHPRHWCKAFFNTWVKCDIVDNNLSEAFNGRILEPRSKTIYSMLEDIRNIVMERIHIQRASLQKWDKDFGPRINKKLEENLKLSRYCHICWNGEDGYEIMALGTKYVIDLKNNTCDCRVWQLTGIPCCHAISALLSRGLNPDDYVHEFYRKRMFLEAYGTPMQPVRDPKNWEKNDNLEPPVPPKLKTKLGRPKKQRRKTMLETKTGKNGTEMMSRKGSIITCSFCKKNGHNKRGCPIANKKTKAPDKRRSHQMEHTDFMQNQESSEAHVPVQRRSQLNVPSREYTIFNPGQQGDLIVGRERDKSRKEVTANMMRTMVAGKRQKVRGISSQDSSTTGL